MDRQTKSIAAQRLASTSGHLSGVKRMVHEDASCIDVIGQIQAVQAALNKVSVMMLESHLNTCILAAVEDDNHDERQRMLDEVTSIFEISKKNNFLIKGAFKEYGN